jgi:hypothetical protein
MNALRTRNAMHEPVLAQKFKRPVGGDRRKPRPFRARVLDNVVSPEWPVAGEQSCEYGAPNRRQALPALGTACLGHRHRIIQAALVVVIGIRKDRLG